MDLVAGRTCYVIVDGYGSSAGTYSMDVTDAGTPPPTGACCFPSGICEISFQYRCAGMWLGEGRICSPNPCPPPLSLVCPPGALIEGEPPCVDGYVDNFNSGCTGNPQIWQTINPQAGGCAVMCGRSCASVLERDSDWFALSDRTGSGPRCRQSGASLVTCARQRMLRTEQPRPSR